MTWILAVLVISVMVALMRGGKLINLTEIRLRGWWLLLLGFGMQVGVNFLPNDQTDLAFWLLLSSYVPLLIVVAINRSEPGMWIASIGVLMNFTVIGANQGMPVLEEAVILAGGAAGFTLDAKHVLLDAETYVPFLADIIPLPGNVISLGDVFLAIGLGVFLEDQLKHPLRLFRHRVQGIPGSAAES